MAKPTLSTNEAQVFENLKKLDHPLPEVAEALRKVILTADPAIGEHTKWNSPAFYYTGSIQAFDPIEYKRDLVVFNLHKKDAVLLIFPTGATIDDPSGLLEGTYFYFLYAMRTFPQLMLLTFLYPLLFSSGSTYAQDSKKDALQVAHDLFSAMERGDTTAFRKLFLPEAMVYTVRERNGQPVTASRSPLKDTFRPGTVIKERMKATGVDVQVHGHMAVVWAPYDLWVNDVFSHCGVDVFTLIKTSEGWRIASLSYTIEKEGCQVP